MEQAPRPVTPADRERIRSSFPALSSGTVFLENAGGTQVPNSVAERIHEALVSTYVQLGAGYPLSLHCGEIVEDARCFLRILLNAGDGEVFLGGSATVLLRLLAQRFEPVLEPGREIVLAEDAHRSNLDPWLQLQRHGVVIRWWPVDRTTGTCHLEDLERLVSARTALVAMAHVSNVVGQTVDLKAVVDIAHRAGARVVADGVAFAPHRRVDLRRWGIDWYVLSAYKMFGPHVGVLCGSAGAVAELQGSMESADHEPLVEALEPGGLGLESYAGLLGLSDYLARVPGRGVPPIDRATVERAFETIIACEHPLQERLVDGLTRHADVHIVGGTASGFSRCGTVSFVHAHRRSAEITAAIDRTEITIRHGCMRSPRLCAALGIEPMDGVVRVSLAHYNTPEEIDRLLEVLENVLA